MEGLLESYAAPWVEAHIVPLLSVYPLSLLGAAHVSPLVVTYFGLGTVCGFLLMHLAAGLFMPAPKRGYGSGENNRWNRNIRTERPVFKKKHHKLEHVWMYAGAGADVNLDVARKGQELAVWALCGSGQSVSLCRGGGMGFWVQVTASDAFSGGPLSGHLIGRHTWKPVKNASLKAFQDSLTFDPTVNVNAGDKLLRAQLLRENGGNPHDANPGNPRGSPSITPQEALQLGWEFYGKLLTDDGHLAGDYGGPHFLLPGASGYSTLL